MAEVSLNSGVSAAQLKEQNIIVKKPVTSETKEVKAVSLSKDQITFNVKRGIEPTFKGAMAGALVGGIGGGAAVAITATATALLAKEGLPVAGEIGTLAVLSGAMAAIPGAIVGAATANFTDSKLIGSVTGAVAGGAFGAYLGIKGGDFGTTTALLIGAGAAAGLAGAWVAKPSK